MPKPSISRIPAALAVAAGIALLLGPLRADALCHHFTVAVNPGTVTEGESTTVTVSRDGNVAPSSVDVVSVNETAKAGQDFPAVSRTVSFTTESQLTFSISTTNDSVHEQTETFRLHLQNGGGCAPNTSYVYDPDARVTITDNDAAPSPTPTATATPSPSSSPTPRTSASPTPSATPSATTSPAPSISPLPSPTPSDVETLPELTPTGLAAGPGDDGGSGGKLRLMIVGGLLLAGSATVYAALRRSRPQL